MLYKKQKTISGSTSAMRAALAACVVLVAFLASNTVIGDALFEERFDSSQELTEKLGGSSVPGYAGSGWTVTGPVSRDVSPDYLRWSLSDIGLPESGSVEFKLKRSRLTERNEDSVVVFAASDLEPLFTLAVEWSQSVPGRANLTAITLNGEDFFDVSRSLNGNYSLEREIPLGEWIHVLFTWEAGSQNYRIFVNGRELPNVASRPKYADGSAPEQPRSLFDNVEWVFGGVEPTKNTDQGWRHPLNSSVIDDIIFHAAPVVPQSLVQIGSVTHDAFVRAGYSGKLVAGDVFTVTLTGEPGGTATFSLGKITGHPMEEDPGNPGTYVGVHTVAYGEDVEDGLVEGRFTNRFGIEAAPVTATRPVTLDTWVYMDVNASSDIVPADESSRAGLTVAAKDANGEVVRDHELKLTLSTTDEYTGNVGGITFEDLVGGELDVDWGGVTDSFGEVTAQYVSGFAAKTILVSAKDMVTGDVGVGWVRSYIDGEVQIVVTEPRARVLNVAGSMDVSLSREWLTADGRSRSRITAVVKDAGGDAVQGRNVGFTLLGDNGELRILQRRTDAGGRAFADYIAGTVMGQVQVEVRDLTSGLTAVVSIELRPDAPAEIALAADPGEIVTGGETTVTAIVTDANGNPNSEVDVLYSVSTGEGTLNAPSVGTDEDGAASVTFTAGDIAGLVTVRGTVVSREPSAEELSAALGAVFLYGLDEDPGRLEVVDWLVETGDEVVEGQDLVVLEDRGDNTYTVTAPRDGVVSTFVAEERDRVEYGDTLGYVIEVAE